MNKKAQQEQDILEFGVFLQHYTPHLSPQDTLAAATRLVKLARELGRLNLQACNVGLTPRQDKRKTAIDTELSALSLELNLPLDTSGDPRGAAVRVLFPENFSNTWGGGWAVPE